MSDRYLFDTAAQSNRPLSGRGMHDLILGPTARDVARLTSEDLEGRSDIDIAHRLVERFWDPPALDGEARALGWHAGDDIGTPTEPSITSIEHTRRINLAWPLSGDGRWLEYWPDLSDDDLTPVDRELGEPDLSDPVWRADWNRRLHLGKRFRLRDDEIHGYIEVPRNETAPGRLRDERISSETALIETFVRACTITALRARADVETSAVEMVATRRADLAWHEELLDGLELPPPAPVVLDAIQAPPSERTFELPPPRLTDPARLSILSTISYWAERASQYPLTFRKLKEDELSDLLATTLGLVFGVADREVFSYRGRTDIRLPVSAIRRLAEVSPTAGSTGTESAFIIEAKVGTGQQLANRAKTQLDGYLPSEAVQSALVFYARVKRVGPAKDRILEALRSRKDFVCDEDVEGSPYPILQFRNFKTGDINSIAIVVVPLAS